MKDHELAKLTNDLRDIAIKYGHTQQLREQIAHRLHPEITRLRAELAAKTESEECWIVTAKNLQVGYNELDARFRVKTQECEELRKDAERYRWIRIQHWSKSRICVVEHPKSAVRLGHVCPSEEMLDDMVDALKESNHE